MKKFKIAKDQSKSALGQFYDMENSAVIALVFGYGLYLASIAVLLISYKP